jgi:hypothetical protein
MNKKTLENMLNAVLRLNPQPILIDQSGRRKRLDVLWRVSGYLDEGRRRQIQIETMSKALGLRLQLYFDCIIEFQEEELRHPLFKQGLFVLKAQWVIPPEGSLPHRVPLRTFRSQRAKH